MTVYIYIYLWYIYRVWCQSIWPYMVTITYIQTSTAAVTQAPPKTDMDKTDDKPDAAGGGGERAYVTRDDQLRRKASTKAKRGQAKKKAGKKSKKKGGKSRKAKKTRSRRLNTLRAASPSPKKRKPALARHDAEHDAEATATWATVPTGSSHDKVKRKRRNAKEHETQEHVEPKPAKAKAAAKKRSSPKAKSKANESADSKVAAKTKAKAKAKAKARGRPKSTPLTPAEMVGQLRADSKYVGPQCEEIRAFCLQVQQQGGDKITSPSFKKAARSLIPDDLETVSIHNIYWTRGSVGVTNTETGRDVLHFSFNQSSASDGYKMAAAIKCAIIAATQHRKYMMRCINVCWLLCSCCCPLCCCVVVLCSSLLKSNLLNVMVSWIQSFFNSPRDVCKGCFSVYPRRLDSRRRRPIPRMVHLWRRSSTMLVWRFFCWPTGPLKRDRFAQGLGVVCLRYAYCMAPTMLIGKHWVVDPSLYHMIKVQYGPIHLRLQCKSFLDRLDRLCFGVWWTIMWTHARWLWS